jgi:hypothetical protein
MKAWEIVGYTYDADVHCVECTKAADMIKEDAVDSEGNTPHPIFADNECSDLWQCSNCGCKLIEEVI